MLFESSNSPVFFARNAERSSFCVSSVSLGGGAHGQGINFPRPCAVSGRKTFCHSLNDQFLTRQRSPHVVTTVWANRCASGKLVVMSVLGPVVFWYVDLLCDAEHGSFEAVQRVLPSLLRRHRGVVHLWCLEGTPEKRRCCAEPTAKGIEMHVSPTPAWRAPRETKGKSTKWLARSGDFGSPALSPLDMSVWKQ